MASTRLSGLISGMDTESIIEQLVASRKTKVDSAKKAQTKLSWKQEAWKDLNKKIQNLQTKYIANMRFSTSYMKKTTKVSNSSAVSVITGENAVNGVQNLKITQLAKTGYLTGAQLSVDGSYTAMSKLSDLTVEKDENGNDIKFSGAGNFTVQNGTTKVDISVDENTTISDILTKIKSAGLNASFDEKNQRFFISAMNSGADNDFSITASDSAGAQALSALGLQVEGSKDSATQAQYQKFSQYYVEGDMEATLNNMRDLITNETNAKIDSYLTQYKAAVEAKEKAEEKIAEIQKKYKDSTLLEVSDYEKIIADKATEIDEKSKEIEEKKKAIEAETIEGNKKALEEELNKLEEDKKAIVEEKDKATEAKADAETLATQNKMVTDSEKTMNNLTDNYIQVTKDSEGVYTAVEKQGADGKGVITSSVEDNYYAKAEFAHQVITGSVKLGSGATKVNGQNAIIELNDAVFENTSNVFEINGLTFTALSETAPGESVTVTTQNDTDGIYDMIKNFIKEYNSLINEMDKLYNADAAKGYEPLTSEEKEAMSESEVEEYEKKIKDGLLRRDSSLNDISQALKLAMSGGVTVNSKTMYLSDFGINTLSYFTAAENEKNAYHIDGDPDDSDTSGNADVLKGLIASDPDTVVSFFTKLSQNIYSKMSELSKSVDGYRSFGTFYDDKKMKSDYTDYTTKISELEEKLNDYEDKWYSQFAKMESALAKLQKNTSAVTALIGGNY